MENETSNPKVVDLSNLQEIINIIFDHIIHDLGVTSVNIDQDKDLYWNMPTDSLFDLNNNRTNLDIGRLSDDWDFLLPILKERGQGFALMLIHAAPLLRAIVEKIGK